MGLLKSLLGIFREEPPAQAPGRNDPCWCGSGKKYKRCHQGADLERLRGQVRPSCASG